MAKKAASNAGHGRGSKSEAIREYLKTNKTAKPKEVVAALKVKGIDVGTNLVSITKARMKIRKAKRRAKRATAAGSTTAAALTGSATGLDSALILYKAARGQDDVPAAKIRGAFLTLVEILG